MLLSNFGVLPYLVLGIGSENIWFWDGKSSWREVLMVIVNDNAFEMSSIFFKLQKDF